MLELTGGFDIFDDFIDTWEDHLSGQHQSFDFLIIENSNDLSALDHQHLCVLNSRYHLGWYRIPMNALSLQQQIVGCHLINLEQHSFLDTLLLALFVADRPFVFLFNDNFLLNLQHAFQQEVDVVADHLLSH